MKESKTTAIGIMSGTSLDGLDLCYARFMYDRNWHFQVIATCFLPYDNEWLPLLETSHRLSKMKLRQLDTDYGIFIGRAVNDLLKNQDLPSPDLICSHGHTVFHQPEKGVTLQIGAGQEIADVTGTTCISDFRSLDVSLGGQGAPLVPIGDALLFPEFEACLNLGGFSNISYSAAGIRTAFDICPVNMALNHLMRQEGKPYDEDGSLARSGKVDVALLHALNEIPVYKIEKRPSLSREWFESAFLPVVKASKAFIPDKLRTAVEHIAFQVSHVVHEDVECGTVLITGGGAYNGFLIERLQELCRLQLRVGEPELISFKEALIFGFLGVLKWHEQINVLSSVTGSEHDSSSGVIFHPYGI